MIRLFRDTDIGSFLLTFLLLVLSGNPLFLANRFYILITAVLAGYVFFSNRTKILVNCLFYFLPFIGIFLIQALSFHNAKLSSALFVLMKIFIGISLYQIIGKKFLVAFVDVMFFLSVISLVGFLINTYLGYLPGFRVSDISTSLVLYTELFDTYSGFIGRNSGMFWEPGAYEGYLNLALCFLIISKDVCYQKIKALSLSVALLTTFSTTGYVVFAVILIVYLFFYSDLPFPAKVALTVLLFAVVVYYYQSLDFLQQKIQYQNSLGITDEGRINDYKRFAGIIQDHFFFGITADTMSDLGIQNSGNGFLGYWVRFGFIGVICFFSLLFLIPFRKIGFLNSAFLFSVVFLTLQGEAFLMYPLYLAIPFIEVERESVHLRSTK